MSKIRAKAEEPRPTKGEGTGPEEDCEFAEDDNKKGRAAKELDPKIVRMERWLELRYLFRRNTVIQKVEMIDLSAAEGSEEQQWEVMDDTRMNDVLYELNKAGFSKPEGLLNVILGSNHIVAYNPIKEYFDNLSLHKIGQLGALMRAVVLDKNIEVEIDGRTYRELFEEYFVKWLCACYFCMRGWKFNDVMLILIGAQGKHKTSFLNYLCPKALKNFIHTGHIEPSLQNYQTSGYLVEKAFINVDDQMENIFGKDYNSMKSIISQDIVSRRLLYHKHSTQQKRIANFCGSVNEAGFLRDSNNRRYLCFAIEDIDVSYSEVDMDDVWAEVKEIAEGLKSYYVFSQEDFRNIDLMDDNFIAPVEENETLKNCFVPAHGPEQWVYYMQFTEILQVLRRVSGNNGLKSYNLQTAMRKYEYQKQSLRRPERGKMPLQLYAVKIAGGSIYRDALLSACAPYRYPAEWQGAEGATAEIDGCPF